MGKKTKAAPEKKVCLKEGQIKQLLDSARGRNNDCEAADEYIDALDERYDGKEEKKSKKEQMWLEKMMKEWL